MSTPYIGEVRIFGGTFAPVGWAFCNGQLLAIDDNSTLFTLIGTTYGGDGQTTFALPDLRSRMAVSTGLTHAIGQAAGAESVTLTSNQLAIHTHAVFASDNAATATSPSGNVWANWGETQYSTAAPGAAMGVGGVSSVGQGFPHDNRAPYLGVSFIIALEGIFPSRN
jgi:microcystin-dependent protein